MRCLIAISSCYDFERNGNNQALRNTWLHDVKKFPQLEYRFFMGYGQGAEGSRLPDGVFLSDVPDDYNHLSYKTRASLRWAYERDYDFVFRAFADTYVQVARLMACGFERSDYHGDFRGESIQQSSGNYASGGPGYWLSRRAQQPLVNAPIIGVWHDDITPWAEDLWVGKILGHHLEELRYFDDQRFVNHGSRYWPAKDNVAITSHLSCPDPYTKDVMYAAHKVWTS